MRRVRTTKSLARRMDLQYFTKLHPLRQWRMWLSIAVPVVAVIWFFSARAAGQKVYSSGPLSAQHAFFGKKCELCHVTRGFFHKEVKDTACLSCHDAPAHHPTQVTFTPSCGSCHVEHKSSLQLAHTMDAGCTQCHGNLEVRSGEVKYERSIEGFDHHHPEFAALRAGATDPGTIRLNHYAHLHAKIAGPNGPNDSVQMTCGDCHRPASDHRPWPYAREIQACPTSTSAPAAELQAAALTMPDNPRDAHARAYMQPIRFAKQCAGCHMKDLQFDKRFNEFVPHCQTDVVQSFLVKKYTEYIAAHPSAISEPTNMNRVDLSSLVQLRPLPKTSEEWIKWQVAYADQLLFDHERGCGLCHQMVKGEGPIPIAAKSAIPVRWLNHADFDHDAHRMVKCESCHTRAPLSQKTSDILLPGIASCRGCHQQGGAAHDAADGRCSECHQYHDWRKEQSPTKDFSIPQLRSSAGGMQ